MQPWGSGMVNFTILWLWKRPLGWWWILTRMQLLCIPTFHPLSVTEVCIHVLYHMALQDLLLQAEHTSRATDYGAWPALIHRMWVEGQCAPSKLRLEEVSCHGFPAALLNLHLLRLEEYALGSHCCCSLGLRMKTCGGDLNLTYILKPNTADLKISVQQQYRFVVVSNWNLRIVCYRPWSQQP